MAVKRFTMFFDNVQGAGWSETHFATDGVQLPALIDSAQAVVAARAFGLGGGAHVTYVRVSDDAEQGDSLIYTPYARDGSGGGNGDGDADYGGTAINVRLQNKQAPYKTRGSIQLRGIPDVWVFRSGAVNYNTKYPRFIDAYIKALQAAGLGLRKTTTIGAQAITGITQNVETGVIVVATSIAIGANAFPPGNIVNITKLRGMGSVRGRHSVLTVGPGTTVSFRSKRFLQKYLGGGQIGVLDSSWAAIQDYKTIGVTHRKVGRPFDAPVGRVSVR